MDRLQAMSDWKEHIRSRFADIENSTLAAHALLYYKSNNTTQKPGLFLE